MTTLSDVMAFLAHLLYLIAWVWLFAAWRVRRKLPQARLSGRLLPVLAIYGILAAVSDAIRMTSTPTEHGGAFTAIMGVILTAGMLVLTERLDRLPDTGEDMISDRLVRLDETLHRIDPTLAAIDFDMTVIPARLDSEGQPIKRFDSLKATINANGSFQWDGREWDNPNHLATAWANRLKNTH